MTAVHPELEHSWQAIRAGLRDAVTDSTWHLWLEPLELRGTDGDALVIAVPERARKRVADRYGALLQTTASAVLGSPTTFKLVTPGGATEPAGQEPQPTTADRTAGAAPDCGLNPRFAFDQYVIGDANRFAHAAALAVAEMPGIAYNPLYICGPPGVGKTHLLHSIGNYVRAHGDGLSVRYTTVEEFTNHFVSATHGSADIDGFKSAYRGVDVLLVDDVQFLQRKVKTEEEFFHTFNSLLAAGAQLVLSSDRLPRDLGALEERLRERFESGLVADVAAPDHETRMTILRKRLEQDGVEGVDPTAIELIARRVTANIRALEGALVRVVAFASLTGRPVTEALAGDVLDGLYPDLRPRSLTVHEIQQRTCAAFGIALDDLLSSSRSNTFTWPRQVAMFLARELTEQSLPALGEAFGGRSHTTILHAYRRTAERMATDRDAFDTVTRLTEQLRV